MATGFYGSKPDNIQCALRTIEDDKFDFSGEFTIVMKCEVTENRTDYNAHWQGQQATRCEVFGGYGIQNTHNNHLDLGILIASDNTIYTQWEIASNNNDNIVFGPYSGISQNMPFLLRVVRRRVGSQWCIETYLSMDNGRTWNLQTENENAMDTFEAG